MKGLVAGDIKHHDDCMSSSVVACSDGVKSLLSCCIPQLHLNPCILDSADLALEVYSDGGDVILLKDMVDKSGDEGRFPDTCIPDH